ncbi:MAG: enoyl-CoA hydratase/isomerase family protein [Saprospiraceae bacterium]|nr:enoyl-CoA hydratase/isomerase family protein [Saprospiraceae bacterium]
MIHYTKDTNNIVTLTLDMNDKKINIINHNVGKYFVPVLQYLKDEKAKGQLKGIIITSAKKSFLIGDELDYLHKIEDPKLIFTISEDLKKIFRDFERPGVPVVAAINGDVLGIGFELVLACHHRISIDQPSILIGLPESTLGLMPGNGGCIRLLWLLGLEKAYQILTSGHKFLPKEALKAGIIDELAVDNDDLLAKAKHWILVNNEGRRPWDTSGGQIKHGNGSSPDIQLIIRNLSAQLQQPQFFQHPSYHAILNTLVDATLVDFDTACRLESYYYSLLVLSKEAKSMSKTLWFDYNLLKQGNANRPKGFGKFRPKKIGIIGAGYMGSSIALHCALNGLDVVLKDISKSVADSGKAKAQAILEELIALDRIGAEVHDVVLKKITTTASSIDFEACDIVLEAVFENKLIKTKVLKDAEEVIDEFALVASNTSSISISTLSEELEKRANFVGVHFFTPVENSHIVEIIKGKSTTDETLAKAIDFVTLIKKIPIVVKDNPGFFVARVQNIYILEGIALLLEGYAPSFIENMSIQSGMPKGALTLADEIGLNVVLDFEKQAQHHYGKKYIPHPAVEVLKTLIEDYRRIGKNKLSGFYDYDEEQQKIDFWKNLTALFPTTKPSNIDQTIIDRFLFVQSIEASWCMQERIIELPEEANLGSIFGWGYPKFKGGVLQYINDYGKENFIIRSKELCQNFGPRYKIPKWLETGYVSK